MFRGKSLRAPKSAGNVAPSLRLGMTLLLLLLLVSCRQKMANQARYDPLEPSDFFEDGMASRPRIPGTVARGELTNDPYLETGKVNGQPGDAFPFAVTADVLNRGQERFNIYCSQCHGRLGDGNGMIPSRGLRRPPSFTMDRLLAAKPGHFFDVMTNGFGAMPPYRTMIPPRDRWAIAAYIRALQASQTATVQDVPPGVELSRAPASSPAAHGGAH